MTFVCDYSRSFIWFTNPAPPNQARIQVEARCVLTRRGQEPQEFVLFASCKSEDTYVEKNLFRVPNYDFSGIMSDTEYAIFRIHAEAAGDPREIGVCTQRFGGTSINLIAAAHAEALTDKGQIVAATVANRPLVARIETANEDGMTAALLEFPVKTMNVRPATNEFQIDTGPMLLPDFAVKTDRPVECLQLAFAACNGFTQADFVIQSSTPVSGGAHVRHYSRTVSLPTRNSLYAL